MSILVTTQFELSSPPFGYIYKVLRFESSNWKLNEHIKWGGGAKICIYIHMIPFYNAFLLHLLLNLNLYIYIILAIRYIYLMSYSCI